MWKHNFSCKEQAELLKILDLALLQKQYTKNIHDILERQIQLLERKIEATESAEKSGTKRTQKVTTDVLLSLLQQAGISAVSDDKAKMARLIAYLTDFSEEKIRQRLSNSEELTSYHREEVEGINKIFVELNSNISIKYNKQR